MKFVRLHLLLPFSKKKSRKDIQYQIRSKLELHTQYISPITLKSQSSVSQLCEYSNSGNYSYGPKLKFKVRTCKFSQDECDSTCPICTYIIHILLNEAQTYKWSTIRKWYILLMLCVWTLLCFTSQFVFCRFFGIQTKFIEILRTKLKIKFLSIQYIYFLHPCVYHQHEETSVMGSRSVGWSALLSHTIIIEIETERHNIFLLSTMLCHSYCHLNRVFPNLSSGLWAWHALSYIFWIMNRIFCKEICAYLEAMRETSSLKRQTFPLPHTA